MVWFDVCAPWVPDLRSPGSSPGRATRTGALEPAFGLQCDRPQQRLRLDAERSRRRHPAVLADDIEIALFLELPSQFLLLLAVKHAAHRVAVGDASKYQMLVVERAAWPDVALGVERHRLERIVAPERLGIVLVERIQPRMVDAVLELDVVDHQRPL